jgi:hypothetical protein
LGTDTSSPYSFTWSGVVAGTYNLTAKATDNLNVTGTSATVTVVVSSNTPPTASITSPANNASFAAPATITINANASDANGTVSKVEFFQGTTKLGEDATAPYSFTWSGVAAGTYNLTAKATDNQLATGTSSIVTITVTGGGCTYPQYVENNGYVGGSRVKNGGNAYECKPYPYSGWCNGAAWAYAPGSGTYWQDAWTVVGPCAGRVRTETESFSDHELSVYPNPGKPGVEQFIYMQFKNKQESVDIALHDIAGTKLSGSHFNGVIDHTTLTLKLPPLPSGIYIIRVKTGTTIRMRKYIIKE